MEMLEGGCKFPWERVFGGGTNGVGGIGVCVLVSGGLFCMRGESEGRRGSWGHGNFKNATIIIIFYVILFI